MVHQTKSRKAARIGAWLTVVLVLTVSCPQMISAESEPRHIEKEVAILQAVPSGLKFQTAIADFGFDGRFDQYYTLPSLRRAGTYAGGSLWNQMWYHTLTGTLPDGTVVNDANAFCIEPNATSGSWYSVQANAFINNLHAQPTLERALIRVMDRAGQLAETREDRANVIAAAQILLWEMVSTTENTNVCTTPCVSSSGIVNSDRWVRSITKDYAPGGVAKFSEIHGALLSQLAHYEELPSFCYTSPEEAIANATVLQGYGTSATLTDTHRILDPTSDYGGLLGLSATGGTLNLGDSSVSYTRSGNSLTLRNNGDLDTSMYVLRLQKMRSGDWQPDALYSVEKLEDSAVRERMIRYYDDEFETLVPGACTAMYFTAQGTDEDGHFYQSIVAVPEADAVYGYLAITGARVTQPAVSVIVRDAASQTPLSGCLVSLERRSHGVWQTELQTTTTNVGRARFASRIIGDYQARLLSVPEGYQLLQGPVEMPVGELAVYVDVVPVYQVPSTGGTTPTVYFAVGSIFVIAALAITARSMHIRRKHE